MIHLMVTSHAEVETLSPPETRKESQWVRIYHKEALGSGRYCFGRQRCMINNDTVCLVSKKLIPFSYRSVKIGTTTFEKFGSS